MPEYLAPGVYVEESSFRCLVDNMLTKLGAYLRILGCDASYHAGLRTNDRIDRANAEGRILFLLGVARGITSR